ncbi:hypothetical protein E2C01_032982 [Portunus trituberculatus]|uniref:Uncharacterized protein n=1 Tax=Portunus trituberculatus TaxID=210409 RepID=A0A5B7F172_PORTR|nr:hypothetical protein [Portunus trituberculatus]
MSRKLYRRKISLTNWHVVSNIALKFDALIRFYELARHDISLYPKYQALVQDGTTYYAFDNPISVLTVTSRCAHFEQSRLSQESESPPQYDSTSSCGVETFCPHYEYMCSCSYW